jgi:metal-responsive CopG/Arc/MetJ family transcriptional regulator
MKRGSVNTRDSEMVALWVPRPLVLALDRAVHVEDTDRSKFIRRAVRRRINELGITIPEQEKEAA